MGRSISVYPWVAMPSPAHDDAVMLTVMIMNDDVLCIVVVAGFHSAILKQHKHFHEFRTTDTAVDRLHRAQLTLTVG